MKGDSSPSEGVNHLHKEFQKKWQWAWAVDSPCPLSGPLAVPAALQLAAEGRNLVKQDTYMPLPHSLIQNNQGTSIKDTITETDNSQNGASKISSQKTGLNTYTPRADQGEVRK